MFVSRPRVDLDDRGGASGRDLVGVLVLVRRRVRVEQHDQPVVVALVEKHLGERQTLTRRWAARLAAGELVDIAATERADRPES